jgi:hypothetical protein
MRSIYIPYQHTGQLVEKPSGVAWGTALFPDWETIKKQHKDLKGSLDMNWPVDEKPFSGWYLFESNHKDYYITWLSPYPTESKGRIWPPFTGGVATYAIDESGRIGKIEWDEEWGHEDDMKYTLLQETNTDLEFGSAMMVTNDGLRELRNPYRAAVGKKNINIFLKVMNWTDFPDELV